MSYNPYQEMSPDIQARIARLEANMAAKSLTTVWFNPMEERYYAALNPASQEPDYGIPLTKPKSFRGLGASRAHTVREQLQGGSSTMSSTEVDKMRFQPFTDEVVNDALQFYDNFDKARKEYAQTRDIGRFLGAGTITTSSYPAISNVMIDQTVIDLITRNFVILDAVTRKPWDKLVYTYDNRTPYLNQGGLGELDSAASGNVSYARGTITLKKAQGRVSVSIWAGMAVRDHDIVGDNESIVDADFERIFSTDVRDTATGFADQATAGAWDVIAGGSFWNTYNPSTRFLTDTGTIRTAGGEADTVLVNTAGYMALSQNAFMIPGGLFGNAGPQQGTKSRVTKNSMWPTVTIYIDELATDDHLFIWDKRGIIFLEGPTSTRTVMGSDDQVRDTVNDRWYGSGIKVAGFGVEMTNVHS